MTSNDPLNTNPSSDEPPVLPGGSTERRSIGHTIIAVSLAIFAVSLALPAVEINFFSKTSFFGIHAALLVFPVALDKPLSLMPILAFGNIWLLILPIISRARRLTTVSFAALATWGVALSALSLRFQEKGDGLMVGYYVWVIAFFVAALGATWVAFDRSDKQPWQQVR